MAKTPASDFLGRLQSELDSLAAASQLRRLAVVEGINLCSNDYLDLAHDPQLEKAVAEALAGGCAGGSHRVAAAFGQRENLGAARGRAGAVRGRGSGAVFQLRVRGECRPVQLHR